MSSIGARVDSDTEGNPSATWTPGATSGGSWGGGHTLVHGKESASSPLWLPSVLGQPLSAATQAVASHSTPAVPAVSSELPSRHTPSNRKHDLRHLEIMTKWMSFLLLVLEEEREPPKQRALRDPREWLLGPGMRFCWGAPGPACLPPFLPGPRSAVTLLTSVPSPPVVSSCCLSPAHLLCACSVFGWCLPRPAGGSAVCFVLSAVPDIVHQILDQQLLNE